MAELEEAADTRSFTQARSDFDRSFAQDIQRMKQEPHRSARQPRDTAGRFTTAQRDSTRQPPKPRTEKIGGRTVANADSIVGLGREAEGARKAHAPSAAAYFDSATTKALTERKAAIARQRQAPSRKPKQVPPTHPRT